MPDYHGMGDEISATALLEVLHLSYLYMGQKQVKKHEDSS